MKNYARLFVVVLAFLLSIPLTSLSAAAQAATVKAQSVAFQMVFDGKTVKLPEGQYVLVLKGTSYVPIRFVSYALQKNVIWDGKQSAVTVENPSAQQAVMLKEYLMNLTAKPGEIASKGGESVVLIPREATFIFDGEQKKLPEGQSGYILKGILYVPVRFMSESVGIQIGWDQENKRITAESPAYKELQNVQEPVETSEGTDSGSGAAGGGAVGAPGSPGPSSSSSYATITANAEARLAALKSSCESSLMNLALQYVDESDADKKQQLIAQGQAELTECTNRFNQILDEAEAELVSGGHSTAIIAEYRVEFERQLDLGRQILSSM
ncbi:copper amine oxidase N-terminal domain-containing protein [Paenibacillus abyssi]|uniref:Copper amine oxidase-like N-terminal domain-containing protein n=1 Tax=Paenibacillus abyssi TaxID=1340531 RepID=A0A917CNX7_9BACL|nr:copper amine oxidase N-terminal domain-containing protein [Paenibacillus abyssi]GGF92384.1 hypothetical protein GCM10010916_07210 [Paenibacillus abyssi]